MSKAALAAACAEKVRQLEFSVKQSAFDSVRQELETELAIARVALLALLERADPVAWRFWPIGDPSMGFIVDSSKDPAHSPGELDSDGRRWISSPLYAATTAPVVPEPVSQHYKLPEWTNGQCLEFLAVAFRHAEIKGDFELDDLRLGVKMANAMTPGKEG
ncbi:hypothetical protein ACTV2B_001664 [Cronobacter turicensis]|uniref:hypothetical protein n=1 Tax=Cronobacter turicensis TaxID=413502 RepID=UPI003570FB0D